MKRSDFKIGRDFWAANGRWRCTDIGTRVIVAIKLDRDDNPSWYKGPPYAVTEHTFDEHDIAGFTRRRPRAQPKSRRKPRQKSRLTRGSRSSKKDT